MQVSKAQFPDSYLRLQEQNGMYTMCPTTKFVLLIHSLKLRKTSNKLGMKNFRTILKNNQINCVI